jgi:hypothetical protein
VGGGQNYFQVTALSNTASTEQINKLRVFIYWSIKSEGVDIKLSPLTGHGDLHASCEVRTSSIYEKIKLST